MARNTVHKGKKCYIYPVVDNFIVSVKRIHDDRKAFYAMETAKTYNTPKLIRFEPFKGFTSVKIRHMIKTHEKYLDETLCWQYYDKQATTLDIVASALKIVYPQSPIEFNEDINTERESIRKLRKKLRRHRKKLGFVNMNTRILTPKTDLGDYIKIINFVLNDGKKLSRSQRKKANKSSRLHKKLYKEKIQQNRKQRVIDECLKDEKQERKIIMRKKTLEIKKIQNEAKHYLKMLVILKNNKIPEEYHLDILFSTDKNK